MMQSKFAELNNLYPIARSQGRKLSSIIDRIVAAVLYFK